VDEAAEKAEEAEMKTAVMTLEYFYRNEADV